MWRVWNFTLLACYKLACYDLTDFDRCHKIPGLEINTFITHGTASNLNITYIFSLPSKSHDGNAQVNDACTVTWHYSWGTRCLGHFNIFKGSASKFAQPLVQRKTSLLFQTVNNSEFYPREGTIFRRCAEEWEALGEISPNTLFLDNLLTIRMLVFWKKF